MRNSHDKLAQYDREIQRNQCESPTTNSLNMTEKSRETKEKVPQQKRWTWTRNPAKPLRTSHDRLAQHDRDIPRNQRESPTTNSLNVTGKSREANKKIQRQTRSTWPRNQAKPIRKVHEKLAQHDRELPRNQWESPTTNTLNMTEKSSETNEKNLR